MARTKLILDTRKSSQSKNTRLYSIVFHIKPRLIRLPFYTSISGLLALSFSAICAEP
ncbi:hypothetical protein [Flavivirga sp. 57AJ16]|uniref:hypothetical protein n=1 Tax=Flavivirga sp. 57AJ16 TaxID=3025307 RepID=UPI0023673416|nr:hypothetical protein [Flavivirga sp. 57AJ16]MDD7887817.1 hypothetical protein [Flavivirga sp. 57AJ16]